MTNEQRAHDIALLYAKYLADLENRYPKPTEDGFETSVDLYKFYLESYNKIITIVNRDFSEK